MPPPDIMHPARMAADWKDRPNPVSDHLHAIVDQVAAGVITFNSRLELIYVNPQLPALLRIPKLLAGHSRTVMNILDGSAALDEPAAQKVHETCLSAFDHPSADPLPFAVPADLAAGRSAPRSFAIRVSRLRDGNAMAVLEETTDRLAAEANAAEQAMHDPLTGLPTRRLFHRRVESNLAQHGRLALLMVDLDRFKAVNDTLGHAVGDTLLNLVAKRLRAVLREADGVARLGGDEFALLIAPPPEMQALTQLGRRLVDVLGRPYLVHGELVNISVSVGIAIAPEDGPDSGQLLAHADLALHHAKQSGRGTCCFYTPEMDTRASAQRLLEIDLRKALALREFELHYQPQVELKDDRLVGFEALVRWRHPERGLVPPGDFIPLAEDIGLIVAIGDWVLREACVEAMRWPDTMAVAVNVSPRQFENPGHLVESVGRALAASGLPGRRLEIEITESALMRNEDNVLEALNRLRAMGVRVAMDDFGTGYSSLSQLRSFPFDKIKIDRSFVNDRGSGETGNQGAIIRAITALGASLGMSTIAEGVETSDQLVNLRADGCTSVQGYLFSRPVPVGQIDGLIASFNKTHPDVKGSNQ